MNVMTDAAIQAVLDRVLASAALAGSQRRRQLLVYLMEQTRKGAAGAISEYAIGLDVFGRPESFDPRVDSIVRTEVSRLRRTLREYFSGPGRDEPVAFDIPPRSYAVSFLTREAPAAAASLPPRRRLWPVPVAAASALVVAIAILAAHNEPSSNSLAVLPFQNLSPDPAATQYLADGVTEELTNQLAQHQGLRVVARTSAAQFRGKGADIREIGRALKVAAVLEGSVMRESGRVRITAQLNRTRDGFHLWSQSYERSDAETLQTLAEVAPAVEAALAQQKTAPPVARSTTDPAAHDLYLRASFEFARQTPDSLARSLELFQSALDRDPSYAHAWRGLARTEISLIHITMTAPRPAFERARSALEKALSIDPHDSESLGQLADIDYVYGLDWPLAEREFRAAIEQGAQATTRSYYGWALATRGRFAEAQRQLRAAQDLDPLGSGPAFNQAMAFLLERRFAEAKAVLDRMHGGLDSRLILGLIDYYERDCRGATEHFDWAAKTFPSPVTDFGLGLAAECRGDIAGARAHLAEMTARRRPEFTSPYQLAMLHTALHETDAALADLDRAAEAREGQVFYIKYDPIFDGIRSDARFLALEKRLGL